MAKSQTKVNLITSCSSTRQIPPVVRVGDMPSGLTMQDALEWWVDKLVQAEVDKQVITPREQYRGTGFMTLAKILSLDGFDFDSRIVTGGQGLIKLDENIVPYDFTASPKEHENIHQKVTAEPFVQTVWWRLINEARYKQGRPISTLIEANPDILTLIAMPKIFLRYVSEDILSCKNLDNVRILLAASSVGSVPMQLRPWIVPYDRSAISHIPGNRNDNTHRAALMFLEKVQEDAGWADLIAIKQAQLFGAKDKGVPANGGLSPDQLKKILADNPQYLDLDAEEVYAIIRREHGALGGRMYFRGIFRAAKGVELKADVPLQVRDKAISALKGLNLGQHVNTTSEDIILKDLSVFIDAVRTTAPSATFSATHVCLWAAEYYPKDQVPDLLTSPNKLTHILKANHDILGLVMLNGGKSYALKSD